MNKLFTFLIVIASLYMAASIELVGAGFDEYAEGDGLNIEKYDEDMEDFSDFQRLLGRRKPRRKPKKTCRDGKRCRKNSDCRRGGCTVRYVSASEFHDMPHHYSIAIL